MTHDDRFGERVASSDAGSGRWRWRCADESGEPAGIEVPGFDSQQGAEGWLAENFEDLADDGVATVTLLNGDREVYGPMPLAPDA